MSSGSRVRKRTSVVRVSSYKKPTTRTTTIAAGVAAAAQNNNSATINTVITRGREKKRGVLLQSNNEKVKLEKVLAAADVEMPDIKLEAFNDDDDNADDMVNNNKKRETQVTNIDIKPDVSLLEQHMLLQLQQQQQLQQPPQLLRVLIANPNKVVLTPATTTSTIKSNAEIAPPTNNSQDGRCLFALTPANPQITAGTSPVLPLTTMSKFTVVDSFEKDEFDLQTSDSDEDGYSDIDLDVGDDLIEDTDEADIFDPIWKNQPKEKRMVCNFVASEVGMIGKPKSTEALFYFDVLLGGRYEFFNYLTLSCNQRAQQLLQKNNVGQMYLKQISSEELQVFFALCLEMCNFKLPTLADYWNAKSYSGFQGFGNYMSLSRFQLLLRALNFEHIPITMRHTTEKSHNYAEPLGDLRPLLEFFNQRMSDIYNCGQRLVLNEPIVFWKGRMNWSHNLSNRFRCNALNLHFLTENMGLILKIVPDVDRQSSKDEHGAENSRTLMTHRLSIAKELLQNKLNNGRCIYVSKYYGSYGLTYELAREATYCTSYLDQKRYGNSKELVLKELNGNSHAIKYAGAIMMGKWRRKEKNSYFCSSDCLAIHSQELFTRGGGGRLKIIKELDWQLKTPSHVTDAMINYQIAMDCKDIKWDRNVIIYIFNIIILNSYILYCTYAKFGKSRVTEMHSKETSKLKTYAEFRQDIVKSLMSFKDHIPPADTKEVGDEQQNKSNANSKTHKPMLIRRRDGKYMKKRCCICRRGGLLTLTQYCCEICTGMPGLCEVPCFEIWHQQLTKQLSKNLL